MNILSQSAYFITETNMYCTNCGVVLEGSDAYCPQCGTPTGRRSPISGGRPTPRLTRSTNDAKAAGICGGLAQYLAADPTFVRFICLVATICFPPLLLGYIGAWIIIPKQAPGLAFPVESSIPQSQS
ncbi:MAG: PspC domain-containing protein [Acidobacteriota bacterium]|nr:PspC domain-containing protein [Acidobacteriota bacterium]